MVTLQPSMCTLSSVIHSPRVQSTRVLMLALWLFPVFGSVVEEVMEAVFRIMESHAAGTGTMKATVRFLLCPLVRLKPEQRMLAPTCAHSGLEAEALKVSPVGMGSVTTTLCAVCGPLFTAMMV